MCLTMGIYAPYFIGTLHQPFTLPKRGKHLKPKMILFPSHTSSIITLLVRIRKVTLADSHELTIHMWRRAFVHLKLFFKGQPNKTKTSQRKLM